MEGAINQNINYYHCWLLIAQIKEIEESLTFNYTGSIEYHKNDYIILLFIVSYFLAFLTFFIPGCHTTLLGFTSLLSTPSSSSAPSLFNEAVAV